MDDEILTVEEAAKFLKLSQGQVRKLIREGELPVIRRGRRYTRVHAKDLLEFVERYTVRKGDEQ